MSRRITPRIPAQARTTDRREPTKAQKPQTPGLRPFETFEGTFLGHPEGAGGFLRLVGLPKVRGADLLVDWRDAHGAIHGDRVVAEVCGEGWDGRLKARVLEVKGRGDIPLPGTLQKQPWGWRVVPLEPRLPQVISVPATDLAEDGELVSVKLDPDPNAQQLRGTVVARLGKKTDLKIENRLTAALFNLRTAFPDAVMAELAPFPTAPLPEWIQGRENLRDILTCTVDPPTAKDFDDAISLEPLPESEGGGWLLGVHIADVSHYVREGGPLDEEARLRGTSVYFPDEAIPMIPERLSGDLCSLREGVDRLTMTAWMTLSPDLEVVETRLTESMIRSAKRLTYDEVKDACIDLSKRKRAELGEPLCALLDQALVLSRRLTKKRLGRGAMNLDTEEAEFIFDAEGRPVDARRYPRHDAHRMIEEFMLLANEAVARFFTRKKIPAIYRIHDEPDALKLEIFAEVARTFGLLKPKETPTPEHLNAMLDKIRGGPLEAMINTLLLRSLKRAEYSVDNIGHSGLALQDYLHFTSPIRRYPDLLVHRLLRKVLRGQPLPEGLHSQLAVLAKGASDAEQKATEAERENDKWKACLLMKSRLGQRFKGRIQGYSAKVVFITLDAPFVEVGVPLAALGGNFWVDEHRTKATGLRGTVVLTIGDGVEVEITTVDEDLRRVSAWMTEAKAQDAHGKAFQFVPTLAAPAVLREGDLEKPRGKRRVSAGGERSRKDAPAVGRPPKKVRQATGKSREASPKPPKGSVRGVGKRKGR
ncbi:MAG: VacB/RNase II family 3'-5' exoribonuclease [Holophagaceae bacterium]|uniref:Ribonuclease R n=1 Tax=Candidatus Geothrix skivensis TaxID=2954439 RepID=A0A9D7XHB7_9BACT|nr:VacB/RNase II family 3'-5' exoribonuclease [Candidatus Geothrix skivensis]